MAPKIVIATAGTGGHIFPAIGLSQMIQKRIPDVQITFAGHALSRNSFMISQPNKIDVLAAPFYKSPHKFLKSIYSNMVGLTSAITLLKTEVPKVVIGFGSYHTAPLLLAAVLTRTPYFLFAGDAIPGRVVRLFAPFAESTGLFFPEAHKYIRGNVLSQMLPLRTSMQMKNTYGLDASRPVILIIGGSQGAQKLNALLPQIAVTLPSSVQFLHMAGSDDEKRKVEEQYRQSGRSASVHAFEPYMASAYALADLVIARAGASTIAEILSFQIPALLVPYPHAQDDHQSLNAQILSQLGCAQSLPETASVDAFSKAVSLLLEKSESMRMAQKKRLDELSSNQLLEQILHKVET